jgi:hypothetical protein
MINTYWYQAQLKDYIKQFAGIFTGLQVLTGKDADGNVQFLNVPVCVGNKDRVVAAIMARNTQNLPFSLPATSVYLQGIDLAPERRKGVGTIDRKVYMPAGGMFPDDLTVVKRLMPVPYNLNFELSLYASNTDQLHQILEQILLIFDPTVQIQKNDASFDWTKISHVELMGINNEENYPSGSERRMVVWSLNFMVPAYLSAPLELKNNIISNIIIQMGNLDTMHLMEYDEDGNPHVFDEVWSHQVVSPP